MQRRFNNHFPPFSRRHTYDTKYKVTLSLRKNEEKGLKCQNRTRRIIEPKHIT